MVFFAPRELYTLDVTVMEMLCASVCITSMITFTLEMKYRTQQAHGTSSHPYDWSVHMARHRMGSRGNVTSFPLPWEALLQTLRKGDDNSAPPELPWVGAELADKVSILLKTNDDDDPKAAAQLIHQAHVRRHVVVILIEGMVARKHRAYTTVNIGAVKEKQTYCPRTVFHQKSSSCCHLMNTWTKFKYKRARLRWKADLTLLLWRKSLAIVAPTQL